MPPFSPPELPISIYSTILLITLVINPLLRSDKFAVFLYPPPLLPNLGLLCGIRPPPRSPPHPLAEATLVEPALLLPLPGLPINASYDGGRTWLAAFIWWGVAHSSTCRSTQAVAASFTCQSLSLSWGTVGSTTSKLSPKMLSMETLSILSLFLWLFTWSDSAEDAPNIAALILTMDPAFNFHATIDAILQLARPTCRPLKVVAQLPHPIVTNQLCWAPFDILRQLFSKPQGLGVATAQLCQWVCYCNSFEHQKNKPKDVD